MYRNRTVLNDGAWVAGTQVLSAIGQLLGVRLLTELLSPAEFGVVSLWLGAVTLVVSGLANPTMQALLRFYPEYAQLGKAALARTAARQQIAKLAAFASPVVIGLLIFALYQDWAKFPISIIFGALVLIEIIRMQNTAVLSAIRSQRAYGIWLVLETWLRPIVACSVLWLIGPKPEYVLISFILASSLVWLVMRQYVPVDLDQYSHAELPQISDRFWKYSLPLLPLGIFGWVSGMADRYIIGGMMSAADVGIYVAAYGLASRPVLMLGGIIETTIRPMYQQAVISGDKVAESRYLQHWINLLLLGGGIVFLVSAVGYKWIAWLLLGEQFHAGAYLIPWLVFAHLLLIFSQRYGRVLLAHGFTASLAKIEVSSTLAAVGMAVPMIYYFGLPGAVLAVVFGYLFQAIIARWYAVNNGLFNSRLNSGFSA